MSIDICRCKMVREKPLDYIGQTKGPEDAVAILSKLGFEEYAEEYFGVLLLNSAGIVTGYHEVSHGDLNSSITTPREVFKLAIIGNAASVILAHNHPSGNPDPSEEDKVTTNRLVEAGKLLGVKVVDHIIIGDRRHYSMKANGLIN